MTVAYCTVDQLKASLSITTTTDDAFLTDLVAQAQAEMDSYLGYSFQTEGSVATPAVRKFNGLDSSQLLIGDTVSVVQVLESLSVLGADVTGAYVVNTTTTDITADCVLGPPNAEVPFFLERLSGFRFARGTRNYEVHGIFGRASLPADITRACVRLAGHYYRMRDAAYQDTTANAQFGQMRYRTQMPWDVVNILDRYKRRVFVAF